MLAQTIKRESQLIQDEPDKPVFGGIKDVNRFKKTLNDLDVTQTFEKYVRDRAVYHLKSDDNQNSRALIELADLHFKNQRFGKASDYYKKALNIEPDNVAALQKLIQSFIARKNFSDADEYFKNLLSAVDEHPRYLTEYLNFRIMLSIKDPELVEETTSIFARYKQSNDDAVLNALGLYEVVVLKDSKSAKKYFESALSINPDSVDANNNIGICYRLVDDFKTADKYFYKAHYLDLKYLTAYENLAGSYYLQKNFRKAIAILENAKENKVELSIEWRDNLGLFYFHLKEYSKALAEYKSLDKKDPDNNLILNNIGAIYERLDKISLAKRHFADAITIVKKQYKSTSSADPRSAIAFNNLSRIYIRESNYDEASKILKYSRRLFPKSYESYYLEGLLYLRQRQYEKAKELLEKSVSFNPNHYESILDLSFIYLDIDLSFEKAIKMLEAVEIPEELTQVQMLVDNNLAYAYLKTNRVDDAEKLLNDNDKSFASYATKGYFYLFKDDLAKADIMYKKAFNAASSIELRRVKQFYYYELMEYWSMHNDIDKALSNAKKSKEFATNKSIEKIVDNFISMNS